MQLSDVAVTIILSPPKSLPAEFAFNFRMAVSAVDRFIVPLQILLQCKRLRALSVSVLVDVRALETRFLAVGGAGVFASYMLAQPSRPKSASFSPARRFVFVGLSTPPTIDSALFGLHGDWRPLCGKSVVCQSRPAISTYDGLLAKEELGVCIWSWSKRTVSSGSLSVEKPAGAFVIPDWRSNGECHVRGADIIALSAVLARRRNSAGWRRRHGHGSTVTRGWNC